jgi:hypothetical protein
MINDLGLAPNTQIKLWAHENPWGRCIDLYCASFDKVNSRISKVEPLVFSLLDREDEGRQQDPIIKLDVESATELMTTLWAAGVRPVDVMHSNEALSLQGKHLQDMRRIVENILKVKL